MASFASLIASLLTLAFILTTGLASDARRFGRRLSTQLSLS